MRLIKRAKLFLFRREHRHEIFDEAFQEELSEIYRESKLGRPPVPPARLALATILQAYSGVSDDEAMEAMVMDRRWQLVLDCMGANEPPFSKYTLVNFRKALIEHDLDRRLVKRTVAVARRRRGFSSRRLRGALDSSPLWGAGRVEDTYNLLGHALKKALGVIASQQGRGLAEVAEQAGASVVADPRSLKAALDCDWDDAQERAMSLGRVLEALDAVEEYLERASGGEAEAQIGIARRVREQDVKETPGEAPELIRGVARERLISVEDPQMRHGRKSKSASFRGTKRHVLRALDWERGLLRCPAGVSMPFEVGGVVRFPKKVCAAWPLRARCTKSKNGGRSVSIHPDERLLEELRERQQTPEGREKLRERVGVEHSLAHIGRWQGHRSRYRGVRKNLFDLRRSAVVHNLHVMARMPDAREGDVAA